MIIYCILVNQFNDIFKKIDENVDEKKFSGTKC